MELDSYVRSLVLWMLGLAAAIYVGKAVLRQSPSLSSAASAHFRIPQGFALFLVGMATLMILMDPVHFSGQGAEQVLSRWRTYLPYTAGAALIAAILSGLFDRVGPIRAGFSLAWPSATYAVLGWSLYLWLRDFIPPADAASLAELMGYAGPFLTLLTAYPAAAFASGATGAIVGRVIAR